MRELEKGGLPKRTTDRVNAKILAFICAIRAFEWKPPNGGWIYENLLPQKRRLKMRKKTDVDGWERVLELEGKGLMLHVADRRWDPKAKEGSMVPEDLTEVLVCVQMSKKRLEEILDARREGTGSAGFIRVVVEVKGGR